MHMQRWYTCIIHTFDFMWNHVITIEIMWCYVKFNMWKNFTWNHMWNFTNERISHEMTCDISHVKWFHMKSHVTFHMCKDFIWNYKWNFTCERSSHEIINYKWNFTYVKRFHMKLQVKFHMWKDFTWNYKLHVQVKFHMCEKISHEITSEISHVKW
jgi:hypothetical protein